MGKERKGKLLRRYKETRLGRGGVDLFQGNINTNFD